MGLCSCAQGLTSYSFVLFMLVVVVAPFASTASFLSLACFIACLFICFGWSTILTINNNGLLLTLFSFPLIHLFYLSFIPAFISFRSLPWVIVRGRLPVPAPPSAPAPHPPSLLVRCCCRVCVLLVVGL